MDATSPVGRFKSERGYFVLELEADGTFTLWRFNEDVAFVRTWDVYEGTWARGGPAKASLQSATFLNLFEGEEEPNATRFSLEILGDVPGAAPPGDALRLSLDFLGERIELAREVHSP